MAFFRAARWPALVAALAPATAAAGDAQSGETGLRLDHYEMATWLTVAGSGAVYALTPSAAGGLWIGTGENLVHFDGHKMTVIHSQRPGDTAPKVGPILEAEGVVWTGMSNGGLFPVRAGTAPAPVRGVPSEFMRGLARTADGTVWVATDRGPARLSGNAAVATPSPEGLLHRCVHALAVDPSGVLWAGTHAGLARREGATWIPEGGPPTSHRVDALVFGADGTLWAGTRGVGLWERREGRWRSFTVADGLGTDNISAILVDRRGQVWVATTGGGLAVRRGDRFVRFPLPSGPCMERITALAEDAEGGLWIGAEHCGLRRIAERIVRIVDTRDGLPTNAVLALAPGGDGAVWASTRDGGLARISPDLQVTPVPCGPALRCDACMYLRQSRHGAPWAHCESDVVLRSDGAAMRIEEAPGPIAGATFAAEASDGARWFARGNDLFRVANGAITSLDAQSSLRGLRFFHEGRDGRVWIAGSMGGVASWHAGQVKVVYPQRTQWVSNMHEDDRGTLWMGVPGIGIRFVRDGRVFTVGVAEGLPTDGIVQVLADGDRIWASSNRGLFWIARDDLEAAGEGKRVRYVSLYDAADGVLMHADAFGRPAGAKDARGRLLFATSAGGIAVVDPSRMGAPPPRVAFDDVRIGGRPLDPTQGGGPHSMGVGPCDLSASFHAITFAAARTIEFRHQLRGKDADWVETGTARAVHYDQLDPGSYELVMQARSRDGTWGQTATQIAFVLDPPFHRSGWFLLLVATALSATLIGLHRVRLARARATAAADLAVLGERARIARELHDTLAEGFVAAHVQLQCVDKALDDSDVAAARVHLQGAQQVVKSTLRDARQSVWLLRPQALEEGLLPALEKLARRTSGDATVELSVSGTPRPLDREVEGSLFRIAQEAVANAHRHASAQRIEVQFEYAPEQIRLWVADDGRGFDGERSGQGTRGMRERAAAAGGSLTITSAPGRGTRVTVEIPT